MRKLLPMKVSDMIAQPHEQSQVFYNDWRLLGTDYLVIGRMSRDAAAIGRALRDLPPGLLAMPEGVGATPAPRAR